MKKLFISDQLSPVDADGSLGVSTPGEYILESSIRSGDDLEAGTVLYVKAVRSSGKIDKIQVSFAETPGFKKVKTLGCVNTSQGYYVTIDSPLGLL